MLLAGTLQYMAPEVIDRGLRGYSYPVSAVSILLQILFFLVWLLTLPHLNLVLFSISLFILPPDVVVHSRCLDWAV